MCGIDMGELGGVSLGLGMSKEKSRGSLLKLSPLRLSGIIPHETCVNRQLFWSGYLRLPVSCACGCPKQMMETTPFSDTGRRDRRSPRPQMKALSHATGHVLELVLI